MSRALIFSITVTDIAFMAYWTIACIALFGWITLPDELMYNDHLNPKVAAWNWSFFPLDVIFSIFGFLALRANRRRDPIWRPYALISLVLTMTAGGMAVVYWIILSEFDPSWFVPNLLLLIWPLFFIGALIRELAND